MTHISGLAGLSNVTDIATNSYPTCAIADSFLYCWGENTKGQVGRRHHLCPPLPLFRLLLG